MFFRQKQLVYNAKPEKPDPIFAKMLQEPLGGQWGEISVMRTYLCQGWNCRMPGKYKDMLLDIGTEEIGHVEMLSVMVARLLEGAPAETTAKACADNPALAAIVGGQNPQHAIVAGGGATPTDSAGESWRGKYIVASGNLMADFYANAAAEMQGIMQATRLYNMTDDPGVRDMLRFNIARDTMHQNQWLAAIEQLQTDGLETLPVPSKHPFEERNLEHAYTFWSHSEGTESSEGRWASGPSIDGKGTFTYIADPVPLAPAPEPPLSDPLLYATAPDAAKAPAVTGPGQGPTGTGPSAEATGATGATGIVEKVKDALT